MGDIKATGIGLPGWCYGNDSSIVREEYLLNVGRLLRDPERLTGDVKSVRD